MAGDLGMKSGDYLVDALAHLEALVSLASARSAYKQLDLVRSNKNVRRIHNNNPESTSDDS